VHLPRMITLTISPNQDMELDPSPPLYETLRRAMNTFQDNSAQSDGRDMERNAGDHNLDAHVRRQLLGRPGVSTNTTGRR